MISTDQPSQRAIVEALFRDESLSEWVDENKALAVTLADTVVRLHPHASNVERGIVLATRMALARAVGANAARVALAIGA